MQFFRRDIFASYPFIEKYTNWLVKDQYITSGFFCYMGPTIWKTSYLRPSLVQSTRYISLFGNSDKAESICFNQDGTIPLLDGKPLKLVDKFMYLGSNISSNESTVNIDKAWDNIDRLSTIWKSDISNNTNRQFFQAVNASVLLYDCTTWTRRFEKMLVRNYKVRWPIGTGGERESKESMLMMMMMNNQVTSLLKK